MADQVTGVAKGAPGGVAGAAGGAGGGVGGLQGTIQGATGGILNSITGWGNVIAEKGRQIMDRIIPPEQRASILAKIQSFMLSNPKLSAFLGMNFLLTGVPLFLFGLFSLTVLIFSLVVGLVLGLLAAVAFTLFCVGVALLFVFPTVFFTTMTACFLFLWGLGGYYILKWASGDDDQPAEPGQSIGDKLNNFTGGRLSGFMDSAKAEDAKSNIKGYGDEYTKPKANGEKKTAGEKKGQ